MNVAQRLLMIPEDSKGLQNGAHMLTRWEVWQGVNIPCQRVYFHGARIQRSWGDMHRTPPWIVDGEPRNLWELFAIAKADSVVHPRGGYPKPRANVQVEGSGSWDVIIIRVNGLRG